MERERFFLWCVPEGEEVGADGEEEKEEEKGEEAAEGGGPEMREGEGGVFGE